MLLSPFAVDTDLVSRRLAVRGDVEATTAPQLAATVAEALDADPRAWVLDLSGVTFLPSLAVTTVVTSLKHASSRGQQLDVVSAPGTIARRILEVMGLPVGDPSGSHDHTGDGDQPR